MPIMIYMTAPDNEEARKIAKTLIEKKLVACANIFATHQSLYWWDGDIQDEQEVVVLFKTTADLFKEVEAEIKALHPYDVPCIVSWSIEAGHSPFLEWIKETIT